MNIFKIIQFYIVIIIGFLLLPLHCFSEYVGPTKIISLQWGSNLGQVGYAHGDVPEYDSFPNKFIIDSDGSFILPDQVNSKILVYNSSGEYRSEFRAKDIIDEWENATWPGSILLLTDHTIITKPVNTLQKYDLSGNLVNSVQKVSGSLSRALSDGTFLIQCENNLWHVYSSNLDLLKTFPHQPEIDDSGKLEIVENVIKDEEGNIIKAGFNMTIFYPDKTFTLPNMSKPIETYFRDNSDGLIISLHEINSSVSFRYIYSDGTEKIMHPLQSVIYRYSETGELLDTVTLPSDEQDDIYDYDKMEIIPASKVRYSTEPVLDSNGNIYLWSVDIEHFSILKWTRQ